MRVLVFPRVSYGSVVLHHKTENLSVYQRWPGVLTKANPAARERRELELLREGLQTLSRELFRAGDKAA